MKLLRNAKNFISTDLIELVSSVLISTLLEISRTILNIGSSNTEKVKIADLSSAFDIFVWDSINTIILLTVIIWGVTGLAKMMEKPNHSKRKKTHTLFVLLSFVSCIIWYIAKIFFAVDVGMIVATSVLSVILLLLLTSYFVENKEVNVYKSDNRIA